MWWSSRPFLAIVLALALAGCGFHPLYGERDRGPALEPELASVAVDSIADRPGQILTNQLRDGFNPHALGVPIQYRLTVALTRRVQNLMTRPNTSASRTDVYVQATWSLARASDHVVVLSGTSKAQSGHDVLANEYANVVSGQADLGDALTEIADDIQAQVALWLGRPQ